VPLNSGQILIGSSGQPPVANALTGTTNQVIVNNGPGDIILSLPQDIATTSDPTFAAIKITGQINDFGLTPKTILYSDTNFAIQSFGTMNNGQLLIGSTGNLPQIGNIIAGASGSLSVTNNSGSIVLDTSQNLSSTGSPTFANITDSALTNHCPIIAGPNGILKVLPAMQNGQMIIGVTGQDPQVSQILVGLNGLTVTPGGGGLTLDITQNLNSTGSPTFANITDSALTNHTITIAGSSGILKSASALTNGQILIGSNGADPVASTITAGTSTTVTNGAGSITVDTIQNLSTAGSPSFSSVFITGTSSANSAAYFNNSNQLVSTASLTNGKILIGNTGNAPSANTIGNTVNQTTVTNGAGTITIGTVQDIATISSPTFQSLTLTAGMTAGGPVTATGFTNAGFTGNSSIYSNSSHQLTSTAAMTNGQILIGSTGNAPALGTVTAGTSTSVNFVSGNLQVDTLQNLTTSGTPTFSSVTLATTGGTAAALNYYEDLSTTWNWSGIWAAPQTVTARFVRIGKKVTFYSPVTLATANTASHITSSAVPLRFQPATTLNTPIITIDNGSAGEIGFVTYSTGFTTFSIFNSAASNNFSGAGNSGFLDFYMEYLVA
jgi:hypothetical protein